MAPLHALEVAGRDEYALANLAFLNLDIFFLALSSLATGLLGSGDFLDGLATDLVTHCSIVTNGYTYQCGTPC